MTKIVWKQEGKGEPKEVEVLTFYELGEKFLWIEAKFKDGTKVQSNYFKGEV
jgi:hypothetical protein